MKSSRKLWALVGGLALAGAAQAKVYGFVDAEGIWHFTNLPQTDKRYAVVLRTPEAAARRPAARPGGWPGGPLEASRLQLRRRAYLAQVADMAFALRLDSALLHAVITTESGYNPKARSDKGAMGLMQLMPETARRYCVKDPYDPVQNLRGGSQYLRDLLRRYNNDIRLALAAYNAGEGAVAKHGNRIPPYPETLDYVPRVMELYERFRHAKELAAAPARGDFVPAALETACGLG